MSADVVPFHVEIDEREVADLRDRLRRTRWPERETVDDWSQGVPLGYVRELAEHWCEAYDMNRLADRLGRHPQVRTVIDGLDIHALHVRSPHADAVPLLLTHGWPGSVVEFLECVEPLTDPTAHGGDAADAFHVVIPSLPGYGFSGKPDRAGWDAERTARAWCTLMERLGYERFAAQGGDWGGVITTALGYLAPERVLGIHLNSALASAEALLALGDLTPEEQADLAGVQAFQAAESGYAAIQGTKPQTLGYGLADSPAGQLAWIVEKFHAWTDNDGHPEQAVSRDAILDDVMVYWLNGAAASSARLYWEVSDRPWRDFTPTAVPVAYSVFPKEIVRLSERWARTRYPDLGYYRRVPRGGHFAALEEPDLFVAEVRAGFAALGVTARPATAAGA
ncbi:MAG TPA: epoxide hydrolase [Baekduia sp.]